MLQKEIAWLRAESLKDHNKLHEARREIKRLQAEIAELLLRAKAKEA